MEKLNGKTLKAMIISGANNLFNHYPEIDALNVFPVPDGDTGTNMNLTMTSGSKEVSHLHLNNVHEVAKAFSKGLLMGARGNSGVILSQIFRGFAQGLEGKSEVNAKEFAKSFVMAKEVAYKAVMRPVEGTILTVIRQSSEATKKRVTSDMSIENVMEILIEEAHISLKNTPELLPVLKEVGVVDSGGAGLVKVFEGMLEGLRGNMIERLSHGDLLINNAASEYVDNHEGEFGYCTEFILRLDESKEKFDEYKMKQDFALMGDSIVVVQDEDIVKVHLHTLTPGKALNRAQRHGEFVNLKIENMQEQSDNLNKKAQKEVAIIAVGAGDGIKQMFLDVNVDYVISGGQTMNPSTEDFIQAIEHVNAKKVILLPNNSNIVMAANQAASIVGDNVQVIPTKTIPQGLSACINYNVEIDFETNVEAMKAAVTYIKSGEVTYSIKDTVIDQVEIHEGDFMGIFEKKIIVSKPNKLEVCFDLISNMVDEDSELITLIAGSEADQEEVDELLAMIEDNFDVEVEVVEGKQPVYSFIIGVE